MGYLIRQLPWKKSCPKWKVQFVSYKKEDAKNSSAEKPKKEWDVEKSKWKSLGFHSLMTLDEARVRMKQLSAQARDSETRRGLRKKSRAHSHWKAAQKVIIELSIDPSDWFYSIHEIYDYFHRRRLSLRYTNAMLKFVNLWGLFYFEKIGETISSDSLSSRL